MRLGRAAKAGIALALLVAVGYGGLKAYVYFQARGALKQFIAVVSPFAFVQYGGIGSTLHRGAVHLTNVRVTPNGMSEGITVDRLTLEPGGLWTLLSLRRRLDARDFPESLGIEAQGVTIPLDGDLVRKVEALAKAHGPNPGAAPGAPHCAGLSTFGPGHLRKLGYQSLVSNLQVRYHYDRGASRLQIDMEGATHDLSSVTLAMTLKGPIRLPRAGTLRTMPQIPELTFVYKDVGYTERLKRYCAQATGTSVEDYIKSEVSQSPEAFQQQWGFSPGPGLREAYRSFLTAPGELYVRIAPSSDFPASGMALHKPDDLLAMLNPTVKVNGQRVDDLSFNVLEPTQLAAQEQPVDAGAPAASADAGSAPAPGPRPRARRAYEDVPTASTRERKYQNIAVDDLPKSVGEYVRLTVGGDHVREGSLTRVLNGVAYVEVRLAASNTIVVQIPFGNIVTAEVLR